MRRAWPRLPWHGLAALVMGISLLAACSSGGTAPATRSSSAAAGSAGATDAVAGATADPAVAAAPSSPAGGAPAPTTVRVAIPDLSIATLPLAVGAWQGFYQAEGLDVEQVQIGGQAALPALLAGEVGYLYGWGAASTGIVQGAPLKVLAIWQDRPPHVVVVQAAIQTPADLRGRRLATSRAGGTDDQIIQRVLAGAGLLPDDVEMARLGETSLRLGALLAGQVDATALVEPFTSEAQKEGYRLLVRGRDVLQVPISIVATSRDHLTGAPDEARRFVRGVVRTLAYISDPANKPAIVTWATERYALDPALAPAMVDETLSTIVRSGEVPEPVLDSALESARAQTDRTVSVPLGDVFDFTLLHAERQELGQP